MFVADGEARRNDAENREDSVNGSRYSIAEDIDILIGTPNL